MYKLIKTEIIVKIMNKINLLFKLQAWNIAQAAHNWTCGASVKVNKSLKDWKDLLTANCNSFNISALSSKIYVP